MSVLQQEVAELWMGLALHQSCGPATLSVCEYRGESSLAFTLACIGRGGAVLLLANEKAKARRASQSGAVDFIVDTMSEALRILKNELRQRRSVAVALVGRVEANAAALMERGVQPQFVEVIPHGAVQWPVLVQRGAVPIAAEEVREHGLCGAAVEEFSLDVQTAPNFAERRAGDERLREAFGAVGTGAAQSAAQQWMLVAPRLFPRDRDRVYWRYRQEGSAR